MKVLKPLFVLLCCVFFVSYIHYRR